MAISLYEYLRPPSGGRQQQGSGDGGGSSADIADLFVFNLSIGTPTAQVVPGILDISTQLVWSQCAPCASSTCMPAPAVTFEPNRSASFSRLLCGGQTCQRVVNQTCAADGAGPCGYVAIYGNDKNTTGYLANDTFTFGDAVVPGLVFGCSDLSEGDFFGASGVFGFGRGPLSLVSQLQLTWFSYFWASSSDDSSGSSFVQFGDDKVVTTPNSRSTPLLANGVYPDLYFVNLTGIKVGGKLLRDIPGGTFDLRADGSGGTFLSTRVPVTFLEEAAYDALRNALARGINARTVNGSALGLDLCYTIGSLANLRVPKVALVFDGAGAVMNLKRSNYFFRDNATGLDCLSMLPYRGVSVLGSLLQTDRNMTYDVAKEQLIFDDAGAPLAHSVAMALPIAVWMVVMF